MSNPFHGSQSLTPGQGLIHLALLPPDLPRLRTVAYQYPLKLVSPAPSSTSARSCDLIHTVYLLTYGGGLVAGDSINLHVVLERNTKLILLTQGSTKLFKAPSRAVVSKQSMTVDLHPGSAVCYLPDPVQPFKHSCFAQEQTYNLHLESTDISNTAALCVLDWVSNGRKANGEDWSFYNYSSRNQIYYVTPDLSRTLMLRDSIVLDDHNDDERLVKAMHAVAVVGTLIVHGQAFQSLMDFFVNEFKLHPRVGGRDWDGSQTAEQLDPRQAWRTDRHQKEKDMKLLWSAAAVRGSVVVKFSAKELEHAKRWLCDMLMTEGSVVSSFGERALLCLQ